MKGFRLAIGITAGLYLVLAELVGGLVMWKKGWREWIWETDRRAAGAGAVALGLFMLMPWLLMGLEKKTADEGEETSHGHEKKSVVSAV